MFLLSTSPDATSPLLTGPHAMRYRGFTLKIAPVAGGFRWALLHDGLLLHSDRGLYTSSAVAAQAARAHVDDALSAFDAAIMTGQTTIGIA